MTDYPLAPEFHGITSWINTAPLRMEELKGKVVGVQFWSHSCVNCAIALTEMAKLSKRFGQHGFICIGIHSPEQLRDTEIQSVKGFIIKKHLTFPVAADQDRVMWNAYHNTYWPTLYLIDKEGRIREGHIGEGGYHRIEHDIRHLLEE